jgi:catechol 2,3-dioxygenase-like lactoylglutathione lyase family enzyme
VEVLSSRILLRPADLALSRRFYQDVLGLAIYREFGSPSDPGVVFFLGPGFLEISGHSAEARGQSVMIWLQVRDVNAEYERLAAAGVRILREPVTEPWGLTEMWIEDPDRIRIVLVEVPADHPLRRDPRAVPATRPKHRTIRGRSGRSRASRFAYLFEFPPIVVMIRAGGSSRL